MTIKGLESAVEDLERGRRFYSRHGQGVGVYFLDRSSRTSIPCCSILGCTRSHSDITVYYLIEDDVVIAYRVLDLRQNPESIRDYLKSGDQPEKE